MSSVHSEIPDSTIGDFILWLLGWRRRFRVVGQSMMPLLQPDEEVLVNVVAYHQNLPMVGDVVLIQHPTQSSLILIKRVIKVDDCDRCFVQGDNLAESTDSRNFGWLPCGTILGQVVARFG